MKLKDLSKLEPKDLKNLINKEQIKAQLLSQPAAIINVILVIVTIVVSISSFRSYTSTTKNLEAQVVELEEKSKALDKFELAKKEFKDFQVEIPNYVSENKLIEMLSEIAIRSGVQIVSFSPPDKKKNVYVSLTKVEITITSVNYADIVRFMHDIENSTYSIRIARWSGESMAQNQTYRRKSRQRSNTKSSTAKEKIAATIEIETLEFKDG